MLAARLIEPGRPLALEEVADPAPGAGEALIRVEACGVCASDLHFVHGHVPTPRLPVTLGHEVAGVIEALGPGVGDWEVGDRVAVHPAAPCGECGQCRSGRESICSRMEGLGMHRDGGFATLVVAPRRSLVAVPNSVPAEQAAIATDAAATAFHALFCRGGLRPGENVCVIGCGGLGTHAILLARLAGAARLIAVDERPAALERAREFGADDAVDGSEGDLGRRVRGLGGADLAVDLVGTPQTVEAAIGSLRRGGRVVVVGIGTAPLPLPPAAVLTAGEYELRGCYGSEKRDLERVLELAAGGRLDLSRSVTARFPLERANDALTALEDKRDEPVRVVIRAA